MSSRMLKGFISDRNFIDLLRLNQLLFQRTNLKEEDTTELREQLIAEYPVGEPVLNRELFRILTYLNADNVVPDAIAFLQSDAALRDRMHVAMHLQHFDHEWTAAERYAVIKFFEETQPLDSGSSVPLYVMNVTRDLCRDLPIEEARIFVSEGAKWPNAALVSLYQYPESLSDSDFQTLKQLDQEIDRKGFESEEYKRLRTGIVAMLSQHGTPEATEYMKEIWVRSPERRQAIALGLSLRPDEDSWDYLVRSLPVLESFAVTEVMNSLRKIPVATDDPQALREVILHGLRMEEQGQAPKSAIALLEYWTGAQPEASEDESQLAGWQRWYRDEFPDLPEAELPELEESSPWNLETLTEYFASSDGRKGLPENGQLVYEKAECAKCHRMGSQGTAIGPDLTTVANRFTRKETLESILYPSHIISDQYQTQTVLTLDGKIYSGMISENTDGTVTIKNSDLVDIIVPEQDIEQIKPSKVSLMPSGLVDELSAADIRDLMTYLGFVPAQRVAEKELENIR